MLEKVKLKSDKFKNTMKCWWCCFDIPGDVFHFPYKFENGKFLTCGQFCGWPCVKAYNIHSNLPASGRCSDLITLYRKQSYNKITPVKSAPNRFTLKEFGGTLTIEEFRSGNVEGWVKLPNECHIIQTVEVKHVKKDSSSEELLLTRSKPLKRDTSAIHKMILKNKT